MKKFIASASLVVLFAAAASVSAQTVGNVSVNNTPVLGQGLNLSGSCGTLATGTNLGVSLTNTRGTTNIGTVSTTGTEGAYSGTLTIPSNIGGGPVTISVACPSGAVSINSSIVDPSATVSLTDTSPTIGGTFTASGVCGTTAGGNVSFTLSNASTQAIIGNATTAGNGSFSTNLTVPSAFASGSALLTAVCPTGNVIISGVRIDTATTGGNVDLGGGEDPDETGTSGGVSTTPVGGVAAGKTTPGFVSMLVLAGILGATIVGFRQIQKYSNNI